MLARREDVYFTLVIGMILVARAAPPLRAPLAGILGELGYHFSGAKRRHSEAAMRRALGSAWTPAAQRRTLRAAFAWFWREVLDWRPARGAVRMEGLEHLRDALQRGRGAILWISRGFGRRGMASDLLRDHGFPIHEIHGPHHLGGLLTGEHAHPSWLRRRIVQPFFDRQERRHAAEVIVLPADGSLGFTRTLASRLRENRILRVTGDGPMGHHHVTVPFLGTRERFATGMVSLARASGAPILPTFCHRDETGRYRLVVEPPIEVGEGDRETGREGAIARLAAVLEGYVRRYPEQYHTWHVLTDGPPGTGADRP